MEKLKLAAMATVLLSVSSAALGDNAHTQPMRVVNVTSDSTPGWLPSIEQSDLANKTVRDYLAAKDAGNAGVAYHYLQELDKRDLPLDQYTLDLQKFRAQAGPVIERRIVKVTWTKDPAQAPLPGIYAAIDIASRFANIDRHCGYIVLYQSPLGGDFQVMREESNFIDNASATAMAKLHGQPSVDQMWAQLSSNCPNYPGLPATP